MVTTAWSGAHEADLVGVLIDARKGLDEEADDILGRLAEVKPPKLLILNKVDVVAKEALLCWPRPPTRRRNSRPPSWFRR